MIKQSACRNFIQVNPTIYKKETYTTVLDLSGKVIAHSENGTAVPNITFFRKLIKEGSLEIVKTKKVVVSKKIKKSNEE